jgi:DNA-binding PadR family transcriptional regulator
MKRDKIEKILKVLRSGANTTAAILDTFIWTYPEAQRDLRRFVKYGGRPPRISDNKEFLHRQNQQFYSLLNQLKNQGFIEKETKSGGSFWKITRKGIDKLKNRQEKRLFSKGEIQYKKVLDDKLKVIIFDVPEKEKYKREWLRAALAALGFSFLQQSVWIGKNKFPESFITDLRDRGLLSCVEIFEIGQKGTVTRENF